MCYCRPSGSYEFRHVKRIGCVHAVWIFLTSTKSLGWMQLRSIEESVEKRGRWTESTEMDRLMPQHRVHKRSKFLQCILHDTMRASGRTRTNFIFLPWSNLIELDRIWSNLIEFDRIWSNLIELDRIWSVLLVPRFPGVSGSFQGFPVVSGTSRAEFVQCYVGFQNVSICLDTLSRFFQNFSCIRKWNVTIFLLY